MAVASEQSPAERDTDSPVVGDEVLVRALRQGNALAGETLVKRYTEPLLRYLRRLLGSEHLAEELTQQAWLSAFEHLDRFDPRSNSGGFKAWLFRIATNKAHDHWRSKGRERNALDGINRLDPGIEQPASASLEHSETVQRLKREIDRLPAAQREVVLLRYYSGLKFTQIAELLGCPLNTALGRMHKAVQKLRAALDDPAL